ncbi:uncharacterized protein LOC107370927 isoform X2 [Tetranychus urticae]|uniref:uncharacterized protein LOC107370927 isoform X2 n=1 Tax=Tetranychus urticae TaxID=32264 RepID=UPI00077BA39D|nr:uncharacterized protein LOC107370927 isoform X2 [Tetranychus urticae]
MDYSILVKVTNCFTLQFIICYLSSVNGQYYGDPYSSSSSINRYGYRYGNGFNYGSKYSNPYNGQYSDPNRQSMNPTDQMTDPNSYWKIFRDRYPQGFPSLSSSMPPQPSSMSSSSPLSSSSSLSSSGMPSMSPFNSQSQMQSQSPFLSVSSMPGQPPLSNFDAKYGVLGPANFVDSTATFDHRLGWVPRYPNFVLPSGAYHFPATGHPYSYHRNRIARGVADIRGADNKITGSISFEQEENDHVIIRGKILGLPPGAHGMHVLEKALTGNDCSSGGDHYNPQKTDHGGKHDWVRHVGDLGNIFADRDGVAYFDLTDQIISITGGYSVLNRTIVITEKPDDLGRSGDPESKRTGNSGQAIACGLIQLAKF